MKYLEGGDEVFGPNYGEAKVYTAVSAGYEARCPNVAALLKNLQFNTAMENEVMLAILNKARPEKAARDWLAKNPQAVVPWLQGVKTFKGGDAASAVAKALKG
jgi:glycine betaine/proline transport system substrate-binding protein